MKSLVQLTLLIVLAAAGCSARNLAVQGSTPGMAPPSSGEVSTSPQATGEPGPGRAITFDGSWAVSWCDRKRPERECGAFRLQLIQDDDRLCGSFFGARPGLSQIDEGEPRAVKGQVVGSSAVLTVRSGRSGVIYLVRLSQQNGRLHWKVVDTVLDSDTDVDLIALDTSLEKDGTPLAAAQYDEDKAACVGGR